MTCCLHGIFAALLTQVVLVDQLVVWAAAPHSGAFFCWLSILGSFWLYWFCSLWRQKCYEYGIRDCSSGKKRRKSVPFRGNTWKSVCGFLFPVSFVCSFVVCLSVWSSICVLVCLLLMCFCFAGLCKCTSLLCSLPFTTGIFCQVSHWVQLEDCTFAWTKGSERSWRPCCKY